MVLQRSQTAFFSPTADNQNHSEFCHTFLQPRSLHVLNLDYEILVPLLLNNSFGPDSLAGGLHSNLKAPSSGGGLNPNSHAHISLAPSPELSTEVVMIKMTFQGDGGHRGFFISLIRKHQGTVVDCSCIPPQAPPIALGGNSVWQSVSFRHVYRLSRRFVSGVGAEPYVVLPPAIRK